MAYIIGMDIGTTGIKSILMEYGGKILARDFTEYPLDFPQPGWAEQDPHDWWRATCASVRMLLSHAGVSAKKVDALSFSGQMHGLVCLDNNLQVLRPAILWCDQRTTRQCKSITRKIGSRNLIKLVYNPALEGFTLPKLQWVRENEPSVYKRIHTILLPKDYVRFRLTGKVCMEVSDAAGTLMFDVAAKKWSESLLEQLGISAELLPPVFNSIDSGGEVTEEAAAETGLAPGTPVICGGADNACAAVGNGIIEPGLVAVSIGTSGTVIAPVKKVKLDEKGRIHFFNHAVPDMYYLMGVMQAAGLSLKWFRDTFAENERLVEMKTGLNSYDLLTLQAEQTPPGAAGLLWLPYLQGERTPHLNAHARGVLFGLSASHTRAHIIRAVIEGVTFGLRDSLEIMKQSGVKIDQIRLTGGGAKSPFWQQVQADVFNHEVVTMNIDEGPAFGAALLAGVGTGVFSSFNDAAQKLIHIEKTISPIPENVRIYEKYYREYTSLYTSLKSAYKRMAKLI